MSGLEDHILAPAGAHAEPALSSDIFFARAARRLSLDVPAGLDDPAVMAATGDHDTEEMRRTIAAVRPIRAAAVLIPVVERDEPTVLLTQRAATLRDHAGQIAFPGGKIDPEDGGSPLRAALREAHEEIGLEADFVTPVGYLDLYMTRFGYRIVPTLARVRPGFSLTLNPDEVDDVFEVPLSFLMTPSNHLRHSRDWNGTLRSFTAMPFGDRYIWGVTAGILVNLYRRIYDA